MEDERKRRIKVLAEAMKKMELPFSTTGHTARRAGWMTELVG